MYFRSELRNARILALDSRDSPSLMNLFIKISKKVFHIVIIKYNYIVIIKQFYIMNYPAFYKTEKKGEVINLAMVTQMYKRDDMCIVELVSGSACVITEKEMEQIYHSFKV